MIMSHNAISCGIIVIVLMEAWTQPVRNIGKQGDTPDLQ